MSAPAWKYLPGNQVVFREWPDGRQESCAVTAPEFLAWVAEGNTPEPADEPAPVVPTVVSMRQARLALLQADLLTSVNAAIAQADEAVKIEWEYAGEVRRDSPLVQEMAETLDLSVEQLDELFMAGSKL